MTCAERAWREPTWRNMLPHLRAKILHKVADLIESRLDELARMQSRDNGKPLAEAPAISPPPASCWKGSCRLRVRQIC